MRTDEQIIKDILRYIKFSYIYNFICVVVAVHSVVLLVLIAHNIWIALMLIIMCAYMINSLLITLDIIKEQYRLLKDFKKLIKLTNKEKNILQ